MPSCLLSPCSHPHGDDYPRCTPAGGIVLCRGRCSGSSLRQTGGTCGMSVADGRCRLRPGAAFVQLVTACTPASDPHCRIISRLLAHSLVVWTSVSSGCDCRAGSQPGSHNLARYIDMQLPHELGLPQRCAVAAGHTIPSNDDARCQQNSGSASQQPHGISIEQAALVDRVALTAPGSSQGHFGEVLQEAAFLARFRTLQSTA